MTCGLGSWNFKSSADAMVTKSNFQSAAFLGAWLEKPAQTIFLVHSFGNVRRISLRWVQLKKERKKKEKQFHSNFVFFSLADISN